MLTSHTNFVPYPCIPQSLRKSTKAFRHQLHQFHQLHYLQTQRKLDCETRDITSPQAIDSNNTSQLNQPTKPNGQKHQLQITQSHFVNEWSTKRSIN